MRRESGTSRASGERAGSKCPLGAGVAAADERARRRGGGARFAGEAVEPATAGGHEGAGGEAVCATEASAAMRGN